MTSKHDRLTCEAPQTARKVDTWKHVKASSPERMTRPTNELTGSVTYLGDSHTNDLMLAATER
jgi:hypothetical protein